MEFISTNGQKKVTINAAPFKEMCALKSEAMKCLMSTDLDLGNIQNTDTTKVLDAVVGILIAADTSPTFEQALFKCLGHCVYDGFFTITPEFFNDKPEAIEDYYEIVAKCIEVNLRPFFKSLVTAFQTTLKQVEKLEPQK